MKKLIQLVILLIASIPTCFSQATINVNFNGGNWNPTNQAAFNFAVSVWEQELTSAETITVQAFLTNFGQGSTILGAARPTTSVANFNSTDPKFVQGVFFPIAVAEKMAGQDVNGVNNEIICRFNSNLTNTSWYLNTNAQTPNNQMDFVTVVLHELGHGVGFTGGCREDTSIGGLACENQPNAYDRFLVDQTGTLPSPLVPMTTQTENFLTGGNVFWDGNEGVAANNGNQVELFAPNPWNQGSSITHLDEAVFNNTPHALMTPFTAQGEANHHPGPIAQGMLNDIGWDMTIGTEDVFVNHGLKVFPNPVEDQLGVYFEDQVAGKIEIFSADGRLMKILNKPLQQNFLNLSHLKSGVYFLAIAYDNKPIVHHKIVKK